MALTLGDNFSYQGAKPLDARLKYATLADMKAVADATMYDGCMAYCVATDKTYQWKSGNTVDSSTGKWREFESGSGVTDYSDLTNKPQINGVTLTGNKSTSDLGITIPTKVSDLTNDSGFITSSSLPTKVSDLTNDSGFITDADVPTKTSDLTNDSGYITSANVPTKTSDLTNDSGFLTSVSASDVGLGSVVNTGDSATPVSGGTTKFTTGGAYTELAKKLDKPTYKTETLTAGGTSVTFTDMPTTGTNLIDFFTSNGMNYVAISESGTSVTVTYPAQSSNVTVTCRIEEVE